MSYVTYTATGPFADSNPPGLDAAFFNAVETFLSAGWFDSAITSNGSGVLSLVSLIASGQVTLNGEIALAFPGTAQTLTNGSTITLVQPVTKVTNGGNVTGIIMPAGSTTGQLVLIYNFSGSGNITFAASGSNVRLGSNVTINSGHICWMLWDGSAWSPTAGA